MCCRVSTLYLGVLAENLSMPIPTVSMLNSISCAGSLLGFVISYFAYRQYFPHLASPASHHPHSPRVQREVDVLPMHVQSSEGDAPQSATYRDSAEINSNNMELVPDANHKSDIIDAQESV